MSSWVAIGVMSGSSLDGLDLCSVEFTGDVETDIWSHRILKAKTISFPGLWSESLRNAENLCGEDLVRLHVEFGHYLGKEIAAFIPEVGEHTPSLVGCHGHTIFHQPQHGFTFQIGDGETIASHLSCPLVSNFRNKDVALGGQGAPLVPVGEDFLFSQYKLCLNLGGIANVSVHALGFDVCPCNMMLNYLVQHVDPSLDYDVDGKMAESGRILHEVLRRLNDIPYYEQQPPKSLGKEWFDENIVPILDLKRYEVADLLRTCVEHVSVQITQSIQRMLSMSNDKEELGEEPLLVTGGGALNCYLMARLKTKLSESGLNIKVTESDEDTINYKEALIFAFLGLRCLLGLANVSHHVTGARQDSVSGSIHLPPGGICVSSGAMEDYQFHLRRRRTSSLSELMTSNSAPAPRSSALFVPRRLKTTSRMSSI